MTGNAPAIQSMASNAVATLDSMVISYETILQRKKVVQNVMEKIMQKDVHYGVVPGCGNKPTLLQPGAEAISSTFQLSPRYTIKKTELGNGHREYEIVCDLYALNANFAGSGVGSATTMEGKYRFRKADQTCPDCGKATIRKSKQEYGGGWYCASKDGGCGAKFKAGDARINNQDMGRVEHDNPADYYNTVLKMASKRAFIAAIKTTTGCSDIFTQDIEDMPEVIPGAAQDRQEPSQAAAAKPASQPKPAPQQQAGGQRMGATTAQVAAINKAAKEAGIAPAALLAEAKRRFKDDSMQDIGQLWSDEADDLLEAIQSGQFGQPSAYDQMGDMPEGM